MTNLQFLLRLLLITGLLNAVLVLCLAVLHRMRANPKPLWRVFLWSFVPALLVHVAVLLNASYIHSGSSSLALAIYYGPIHQMIAYLHAVSLLSVATPYLLGKYYQVTME